MRKITALILILVIATAACSFQLTARDPDKDDTLELVVSEPVIQTTDDGIVYTWVIKACDNHGSCAEYPPVMHDGDLNNNGVINLEDFDKLAENWLFGVTE